MKIEIRLRADNERGLFAIENIKKGEFICVLPIDYFQLDDIWYGIGDLFNVIRTNDDTNLHNIIEKIDFRYGILCNLRNNQSKNQFENFILFLKKSKQYKCNVINKISKIIYKTSTIIGVSNPCKLDDIFIGHIINDYVDMSFLTENKYKKLSDDFCNVRVLPKLKIFTYTKDGTIKKRPGLKIKALRDIEKGEELYLSYGSEYWKKYSGKEKFIYSLELLIID